MLALLCALAGVAVGLRLPTAQPAHASWQHPAASPSQRGGVVSMLAKKKKGNSKVSKAADAALAALEAFEPGEAVAADDGWRRDREKR